VDDSVSEIDPDIIQFDFEPGNETSGTITATFTDPPEAVGTQAQVDWSYTPFDEGEVSIDSCSVNTPTVRPDEAARVSFDVSNSNRPRATANWSVSVDGSPATSGSEIVRGRRTSSVTATIPASELSEGDNDVTVELTGVERGA
jgi:hypothetical protein